MNQIRCYRLGLSYLEAGDPSSQLQHLVALFGLQSTLHSLLQKGINIQLSDNSGYTALHYAAARDYDEVVRMLLAAHAGLDAQSLTVARKTPVACAAEAGHLDTNDNIIRPDKRGG